MALVHVSTNGPVVIEWPVIGRPLAEASIDDKIIFDVHYLINNKNIQTPELKRVLT